MRYSFKLKHSKQIMKNQFIIIATLWLLIFGTSTLSSQNSSTNKNNYLVLSKNIQQLNPILLTANELAKEDKNNYGAFYVIICGKTVTEMVNNVNFDTLLEKAKNENIKVFACGISLNKFNVNPKLLPKNIEVIENGILYGFQLAKKGFISLTI